MPLGLPAIEERPHGDRPVTIEPRPYQFLRAGGPQPLLVRLDIDVDVVIDLGRDGRGGHIRLAKRAIAQTGIRPGEGRIPATTRLSRVLEGSLKRRWCLVPTIPLCQSDEGKPTCCPGLPW